MRNAGLDLMRAAAILLVMFRHSTCEGLLHDIGWIGVDLFFVLSGFLISGLIFREFETKDSFSLKRFFIRRGLKIYPGFYFFFFVTLVLNYLEHNLHYHADLVLAECFFLQSYLPHIWGHTWSIAVEEHFYLFIGLAAAAASRWRILMRISPGTYILTGLLLMWLMRFVTVWPMRWDEQISITATHIRADGILIGVGLAWLVNRKHFRIERYGVYASVGLVLASSVKVFESNDFLMSVVGLPLMNIGFAILILLAWQLGQKGYFKSWWCRPITTIGEYSYAIYLWHLFALQELYRFQLGDYAYLFAYMALSIVFGIIATFLVEKPVLKFRDRQYQ